MLRLIGTNKLQVVLSGAATASRVTVSYLDFGPSGIPTGGTQLSVTNGATPVDICDAPAANTTRQVDHIKLVAKAAMTPTFSVNDGTAREWHTVTLASGDVFDWSHSGGVKVLDSSGQIKSTMPGYLPLTGGTVSGAVTLSAALTYGGVTLSNAVTGTGNMVLSASPTLTGTLTLAAATASGLITGNAGVTVASGQTLTLTGVTVAGQPTWSSAQTIPGIVLSGNITESGARAITITGALSAGAISGTTITGSGNVVSKLTDGGYVNNWVGSLSAGTVLTTGQSVNITCDSGKFFLVALSTGESCVFHASYTSATITLVANPDGTGVFVASSTPGAGIIGISKSGNSHVVNIKNGAGGGSQTVQFCALGGSISAASAPA